MKTVNASSSFKKGTDQTGDVANIAPPFLGIKGLKVVLKTPIKHKREEKIAVRSYWINRTGCLLRIKAFNPTSLRKVLIHRGFIFLQRIHFQVGYGDLETLPFWKLQCGPSWKMGCLYFRGSNLLRPRGFSNWDFSV